MQTQRTFRWWGLTISGCAVKYEKRKQTDSNLQIVLREGCLLITSHIYS